GEVYAVSGAGETVVATCGPALAAGGTLGGATVLANHAAGVVVGKLGTATLRADELRAAIAANRGGRPIAANKGGRLSARALKPADGVRGHRSSGAREAREQRTGPRRS